MLVRHSLFIINKRGASVKVRQRFRRGLAMMSSSSQPPNEEVFVHDNRSIFIPGGPADPEHPIALLVLNNQIGLHSHYLLTLWNKAVFKVSADGASNWIYDEFKGKLLPDLIIGDMDSVRPEVSLFFEQKGVTLVTDKCDENYDITKCLSKLKVLPDSARYTIVIAGVFGGRFDHEMGNLNLALQHLSHFFRILLLSTETCAEILSPNIRHRILPDLDREGPICGLIPLFGACEKVDTKGLRWNMNERRSAFGGLVSVSNEIVAQEVEVHTDAPILWTTSFHF